MKRVVEFLSLLHDHNEREWFETNKTLYREALAEFNALVERLIEGIGSFDASVRGLSVKDCTYRIYRDTRFSRNKEPYKNWLGAYFAPRGKKSGFAGYYFHVEPCGGGLEGNSLLSAGLYMPQPVVLRSVRDEVYDNGAQLTAAIGAAKGFTLNRGNALKRTPAGFPAGSEYDDLLRLKDFYLECAIDSAFLLSDDLVERTVRELRKTEPFVAQLNRAVAYAYEEMM